MMLIRTKRLKVSRRGAFLALFGVVFIVNGFSFLNVPPDVRPLVKVYLRTALAVAPLEVYGWAWIVAGVLAIIGGIWHRFDWVGFGAAVVMPLLWSGISFVAAAQGVPRSWPGAFLYLALGGALMLVAGMYDPLDNGKQ